MEKVSVRSSDLFTPGTNTAGTDTAGTDNGCAGTHDDLDAVVAALANHDLRRRLQLVIGATLAGSREEESPEVENGAVFAGGRVFSFGPFQLHPSQRLLLEDGRKVQIGSRAFDILTVLVERAGAVVGKDELIDRVWRKLFVDDSNLKTQVSALRRVLGEGHSGRRFIVTIPGRGYNFVAPVRAAAIYPRPRSSKPAVTALTGADAEVN